MAKNSATAFVNKWVRETEQRMSAVVLDATQETVNIAQNAKAKGGLMPVDTGFLRASGQQSYDALPVGPTRGRDRKEGEEGVIYRSPDDFKLQMAGFKLGTAIYFGWTAVYARRQNALKGFRDNAAKQWPRTVKASIAKLAKRLGR